MAITTQITRGTLRAYYATLRGWGIFQPNNFVDITSTVTFLSYTITLPAISPEELKRALPEASRARLSVNDR